jgi:hypothetical protein
MINASTAKLHELNVHKMRLCHCEAVIRTEKEQTSCEYTVSFIVY